MALEFIAGADKFYTQEPMANYTPTGPVLRPIREHAATRTWHIIHKEWQRATALENNHQLQKSALSVEVEPAPKSRRAKR